MKKYENLSEVELKQGFGLKRLPDYFNSVYSN